MNALAKFVYSLALIGCFSNTTSAQAIVAPPRPSCLAIYSTSEFATFLRSYVSGASASAGTFNKGDLTFITDIPDWNYSSEYLDRQKERFDFSFIHSTAGCGSLTATVGSATNLPYVEMKFNLHTGGATFTTVTQYVTYVDSVVMQKVGGTTFAGTKTDAAGTRSYVVSFGRFLIGG
jgi:hypothetical protein